MSASVGPRFVNLLDVPIGAGYLAAGLMPALVPEAWRLAVAAMAEVSLAAAVAVPLLGAAVLRLSPDPRHARRRVALLAAIVGVTLPQMMLFRNPDATPPEFLAPLLPALTALLPLWRAAGESWPGLALERRLATFLPLLAVIVGALFFALLRTGWNGTGAIVVLAGLTLPILAIARSLLARRLAPPSRG
jgi:hypothetical protein